MPNIIYDMEFRRRFSVNPYKSLVLPLGEYDCHKDWINSSRGNPYPLLEEGSVLTENIGGGKYTITNGSAEKGTLSRMLGLHFPFATYEMTYDFIEANAPGGAGFRIFIKNGAELRILAGNANGKVKITCNALLNENLEQSTYFETGIEFAKGMKLIVSFRGNYADIYLDNGSHPQLAGVLEVPGFENICMYETYMNTYAAVVSELDPGESASFSAKFYLDGGISQADTRCVCYEDGSPVIENGRVFVTFSARMEAGGFQGVASWNPTTSDIRMEGAIFFDAGDGRLCGDVATSLVYDRREKVWLLWACSFSHGHILCHGTSGSDLRFGINVLDVELMPVEKYDGNGNPSVSDDCSFFGKCGDEDPDFVYDADRNVWQLAVCRVTEVCPGTNSYRYFMFESDNPFTGYRYVGQTSTQSETGGSIVTIEGEKFLICGAHFDRRSNYYIHPLNNLKEASLLKFDYDDGGFRGWGTVIPYPSGSRMKYYHMTFDRHNGSDFNWSYGNLYVFEADRYSRI